MDRPTFAERIAAHLAAEGYTETSTPETAAPLTATCDRLLTFADGYRLSVVCLVDGETRPGARFELAAETVRAIVGDLRRAAAATGGAPIAASVTVIEIAPGPVDERAAALAGFRRSGLFDRRPIAACVVDTTSAAVWSSASKWTRRLTRFLTTPPPSPGAIAERRSVAVLPRRPAWATWGLAALLVAIYAIETLVDAPRPFLDGPSTVTLTALGGVTGSLVVGGGEWFRLLAAELLHAGPIHLGFNVVALALAGVTLERLVGSAWFLTLFVVGAVGASGLSIAINPPDLVGVGASGGIMALFAATLVLSWRFPPGAERSRLRMNSLQILMPTLVAIGPSVDGATIDFGAHLGGALTGLGLGAGLLAAWPRRRPSPGVAPVTLVVLGGAVATLAVAAPRIAADHAEIRARDELAPPSRIAMLRRDALSGGDLWATDYPGDPRGHLLVTGRKVDQGDFAGAEREARLGLGRTAALRLFDAELRRSLEMALGLALRGEGRDAEARAPLADACRSERVRADRRMVGLCP